MKGVDEDKKISSIRPLLSKKRHTPLIIIIYLANRYFLRTFASICDNVDQMQVSNNRHGSNSSHDLFLSAYNLKRYSSEMRKAILALCFMFGTAVCAQGIGCIKFGTNYQEAVAEIKASMGEPVFSDTHVVTYKNAAFEGFTWSEVTFRFKNGKLAEARCYMNQANKNMAVAQLGIIAKAMGREHSLSMDYEDDGNLFYAGGLSPMGYGRLFTLFISPRNGTWTTQMRFGPFSI